MLEAAESPFRVPFDGSFRLAHAATAPADGGLDKKQAKTLLQQEVEEIDALQRRLYADDRYSLLLIFQALDAAGKDGTIRAVMSGVNPQGCQVFSFKQPSAEEIDHDFLWRTTKRLPERGRIGIFNRSYYEEVLVVRVHPEYLKGQRLPFQIPLHEIWERRYRSIRDHEEHLARSGTLVLKFWLNVSRDEQRDRLLARIEQPEKNWKFSADDVKERVHWDAYQEAFEDALNATSRPWAPWYAIPADHKPTMRLEVARIIRRTLDGMALRFPSLSRRDRAELAECQAILESEAQDAE